MFEDMSFLFSSKNPNNLDFLSVISDFSEEIQTTRRRTVAHHFFPTLLDRWVV